jgi:hypothetical protein
MKLSKFRLYEETVQSPNWQVDYLPQFHQWLTGRAPLTFREDFCGTARISCEWVKRNPKHEAMGLDLDPDVLRYAKSENLRALNASQKKRITLTRADVRSVTQKKFDWIGAFNYSIFEFHDRKELVRYFKAARASLNARGTLFLEVAGGDGFLATSIDARKCKVQGLGSVTQVWEQHQYDPITGVNDYAIHFKLPKGQVIQNAFTYHWRIWSIREIREALHDAGFKKTLVLWEKEDETGNPTGEYLPAENAGHPDFYVAYVVAVK